MKNILKYILNIILPPRCPYCGKIVVLDHTLCESCFNKLHFITAPYCRICGNPIENEEDAKTGLICAHCSSHKRTIRMVRSALVYDDFSKKTILDFKFYGKVQNACLLAKWMYAAGSDIFKAQADIIIPVPLSYRRLLRRGYNQSAILAQQLSKQTGIKADVTSFKKVKHTKPQSSLSENARLKNVHNAFKVVKNNNIKDKHVILIDDVMTTGATLNECAKVLLKAGALSVDALTVARVIKE